MPRLPRDDRAGEYLTHVERLHVAIGYLAMIGPLHKYMGQILRRDRLSDHRAARTMRLLCRSARPGRMIRTYREESPGIFLAVGSARSA